MLTTKEQIITAYDLSQQVSTALSNAQQEPLIVIENGHPSAYLISVELFDGLIARLEMLEQEELKTALTLAENQFTQGRTKR